MKKKKNYNPRVERLFIYIMYNNDFIQAYLQDYILHLEHD